MSKPLFTISTSMLQKAISIAEKISRISAYDSLERMPILRRNNRISSIHSSLSIEANSLSLDQVRDVINGHAVIGPQKEIQEVKNAFEAYERITTFDGYEESDLLKAHAILTRYFDEESSAYRNHEEGVFDGENVIFLAPPPNLVPALMSDLFAWLKKDEETPLIIKSCVFHYEFVFIHPFSDGNGRTARFWQNVLLMRWNKLFAYLPIETEIKKHQNDYYSSINRSNGDGNCNAFIEFMLTMIDDSLSVALLSTAKEAKSISTNVTRLLKIMDSDLPISAKEIMKRLAIKSKETLRKSYLDPALKNGLVKMTIPDKPTNKNQKYYK